MSCLGGKTLLLEILWQIHRKKRFQQRNSRKSFIKPFWKLESLINSKFESTTWSDNPKSQIRSSLIDQLRARTNLALAKEKLPNEKLEFGEKSVEERAIESLIADFLKCKEYEFSLSVLLPECGLTETQVISQFLSCDWKLLNRDDILKIFHLEARTDFSTSSQFVETGRPILVDWMAFLSQKLGQHDSKEVQTELDGNFHLCTCDHQISADCSP